VIVGGEGGGRWLGGVDRQLRAHLRSPFVRQKLGTWISKESNEDLEALHELLEAGKVTPAVVDRTFPLSEVPAAIRYLRDGRARGKVVVTIRGGRPPGRASRGGGAAIASARRQPRALLAGVPGFGRRRRSLITVVGSLATAAILAFLLAGRRHEFAAAISDVAVWVLAVTAMLQIFALLARTEA
jgi:Zinc-binding dehydrogenase